MASDDSLLQLYDQLPALSPPPGVTPNLQDPYSRGYLTIIATSITLPVVTLVVATRIYTKLFLNKHGLRVEDWTILIGLIGCIIFAVLGPIQKNYGAGTHQWNVTIDRAMRFAQFTNYLEMIYCITQFFTKLSITVQLIHIFAPARQGATYWLCIFYILCNSLQYIAMLLVSTFGCWPRAKIWDPLVEGKCVNFGATFVASGAINAFSDLVLLILPIVCVWNLKMSRHRKWGISTVFATGAFACFCSAMRIVVSIRSLGNPDQTWVLLDMGLWVLGEISGGIISCCMPIMPRFFQHVGPKISSRFGSLARSGSSTRASTPMQQLAQSSSGSASTEEKGKMVIVVRTFVELDEEFDARGHDVFV